jgi:glucosamine-phosphate N-acetyltransferase
MKTYFRLLNSEDYYSNYINILSQLSTVNKESISQEEWNTFISNLNDYHQIIVLVDLSTNKIIGSGTLLIENKIIHNMGKVAHIEDIVTDESVRGYGFGKMIIDYLINISKNFNVYKIILDCSEYNIKFYEKCGFTKKGVQMAIYSI